MFVFHRQDIRDDVNGDAACIRHLIGVAWVASLGACTLEGRNIGKVYLCMEMIRLASSLCMQ